MNAAEEIARTQLTAHMGKASPTGRADFETATTKKGEVFFRAGSKTFTPLDDKVIEQDFASDEIRTWSYGNRSKSL